MLSERLRGLRKNKNLTQKQCAELLNIEVGNYNKWENGVNPNLDTLILLSKFFDVSTDYLLGIDERKKMISVRIILKNGCEFTVKCKEFSVSENGFGHIVSLKSKGATENKLLYLDVSEIVAITRTMSDERTCEI